MIFELLWTLFLLWLGFVGVCIVFGFVREGMRDDKVKAQRAKAQRAAAKARDAARCAAYDARQASARGEL
jgi:hypothetical protein